MSGVLEILAAVAGTSVVVGPSALYAGAKFREHIPIRVPTNRTRIDDAETDLRLLTIARERRQLDLNIQHDEVVGERKLEEARREVAQEERRELAEREGEGHKVLEARLLDVARRSFPDRPWGRVQSADDDVLAEIEEATDLLRAERERIAALSAALDRARHQIPLYLREAAEAAGL